MIVMIMMMMMKKKKKKKKMMMMMMVVVVVVVVVVVMIKYSVDFAKKVSVEELERNITYRTLDVNEMTILK
jgi:flagellar basal body-associated protein FliL